MSLPSDEPRPAHSADRLRLLGGKGSSRTWALGLAGACLAASIFSFVAGQGRDITFQADFKGTGGTVSVDAGPSYPIENGMAIAKGLPWGTRNVSGNSPLMYAQGPVFSVGPFWGGYQTVHFTPKPVTCTASGTPGAEVLVDDKAIGTIGANSRLDFSSLAGTHTIQVRKPRFSTVAGSLTFVPLACTMNVYLSISPAAIEAEQAEQRRLAGLLAEAENHMTRRQYREALRSVDQVLSAQPDHQYAGSLKARIEEALRILGQ